MNYPTINWSLQNTINFGIDNAGVPAIAVGPDDSLYFAMTVMGTLGVFQQTEATGATGASGATGATGASGASGASGSLPTSPVLNVTAYDGYISLDGYFAPTLGFFTITGGTKVYRSLTPSSLPETGYWSFTTGFDFFKTLNRVSFQPQTGNTYTMSFYNLLTGQVFSSTPFVYVSAGRDTEGNSGSSFNPPSNTEVTGVTGATGARSSMNFQNTTYRIVVGKISSNGILQWAFDSPLLVTTSDETQPTIAVGANGEIFIAYMTLGAVQNKFNMANIPNFCQSNSTGYGYQDIVMARIDQINNTPTIVWVKQDASINSLNQEILPQLALDPVNQLLYMTWQCNQNIMCFPSIGAPNVLLACWNYSGKQYWIEAMGSINGKGTNTNPAIAASSNKTVTIALELTSCVVGGATVTGQQVEVVTFQTVFDLSGVYVNRIRNWVGSSFIVGDPIILSSNCVVPSKPNIYSITGNSYSPSIACDPTGNVYVAFLTTGAVLGGIPTGSAHDLVLAKFNNKGVLVWLQQGPLYNNGPITYTDASSPVLTSDMWGNPFVSLVTTINGKQTILLYRIDATSGKAIWEYNIPNGPTYTAYGYALDNAPFSVLPSSSIVNAYSKTAFAVRNKILYVATSVAPPIAVESQTHVALYNDLIITSMNQQLFSANQTPFQYMTRNKRICGCKTATCGC